MVRIGDFGLAKLARDGKVFRTEEGTKDYVAPEVRIDTHRETSEYTNAIDIWALGCITHEILTQTLPFRGWQELSAYCSSPQLPVSTMLSKNTSKLGIEFVERALAYSPELRITASEGLGSAWLRSGGDGWHELRRLLADQQALSLEVAEHLITNLKILSQRSRTPLDKKEILFPAHLINVVTLEMWKNGYLKESKQFLVSSMNAIQDQAVVSEGVSKMRGLRSLTVNSRTTVGTL